MGRYKGSIGLYEALGLGFRAQELMFRVWAPAPV